MKVKYPICFGTLAGLLLANFGCSYFEQKSKTSESSSSPASCTVTFQNKDVQCYEYSFASDSGGEAARSTAASLCAGPAGADGFAFVWSANTGCSDLAKTFHKCELPTAADRVGSILYGSSEENCKKEGGSFTAGTAGTAGAALSTASCSVNHQNKAAICTEYTFREDGTAEALRTSLAATCTGNAGSAEFTYEWSANSGCSDLAKTYNKCQFPSTADSIGDINYGTTAEQCKEKGGIFTAGKEPQL